MDHRKHKDRKEDEERHCGRAFEFSGAQRPQEPSLENLDIIPRVEPEEHAAQSQARQGRRGEDRGQIDLSPIPGSCSHLAILRAT